MKFLSAFLGASLTVSSARAATTHTKGQRKLDEMHAAAFGAVVTEHSASDWKKFLSEGPVQVDSEPGYAEQKQLAKANSGRELWWRAPIDTAEYGGSMEVKNKNKNSEECFNIGEGIGKDGWAFGIAKGKSIDAYYNWPSLARFDGAMKFISFNPNSMFPYIFFNMSWHRASL